MRVSASILLWAASAAQAFSAGNPECVLWARDRTRIELSTTQDPDVQTSDEKRIIEIFSGFYQGCTASPDTFKKLPNIPASSLEGWAKDMRTLLTKRAGVAPAVDNFAAQCAAEYRTWDPETRTVVRKGSPERVPCPCGKEVDCGP